MASDDDDEIRKTGMGSRAEWHPDTVSRLIDGYGDKCANIKGYLKTKDWEEIVKYVNIQCEGSKLPKTMKQCREKIDSLKRRYKLEKRRAEIRGSSHVEWSFFEKLDDIMRNLRRTGNVSEGQSFEVTEALDFEVTEPVGFDGDARLNFVISKSMDRNKACAEIPNVLLDGGLSGDGDRCNNRRVGINSQDRGFPGRKSLAVSDRISKRSSTCEAAANNPVQALANALVGFSEVYSRVEIAKMELFTKMNLELAKLRRKKKRNPSSSTVDHADSE